MPSIPVVRVAVGDCNMNISVPVDCDRRIPRILAGHDRFRRVETPVQRARAMQQGFPFNIYQMKPLAGSIDR